MKNLVNVIVKSSEIMNLLKYSMSKGQDESRVLMKISVALCTYNGAKYIEEQLNSILEQTMLPDEIVICDDNSTDNTIFLTRQILANYTGELVLIINPQNIGYKRNFVKAMSLCTGEIIFLSDQDDVWDKHKIAIVNQSFLDNPRAILVFHDAILVNEQLELLYKSFWKILKFKPILFLNHKYNMLLQGNVIQGSACAFRKNLFYKALPFPIEAIHDEWLALMAVAEGEIIPIAQPLMKYRQSNDNVIGGMPLSWLAKIKKFTVNIEKATEGHFQELWRRKAVSATYREKIYNFSVIVGKLDFISGDKFLEKRVNCIKNRDSSILKLFPLYFRIYISKRYAMKTILKDLLAKYFYNKKTL